MCLGIPMEVIECGEGYALCRANGELRRIDTMLVGTPEPGTLRIPRQRDRRFQTNVTAHSNGS